MSEAITGDPEIPVVVDNPDEHQFEAHVDGHVAFVSYMKHGDTIIFTHTEVPKELQGRGLANVLAHAVLERARAEQWRGVGRGSFLSKYLAPHPGCGGLGRPT